MPNIFILFSYKTTGVSSHFANILHYIYTDLGSSVFLIEDNYITKVSMILIFKSHECSAVTSNISDLYSENLEY